MQSYPPRPWESCSRPVAGEHRLPVSQYGPLSLPALWRLGAGPAEALRAIASAGLLHRDLKPPNVILASDGPRVIDFGIARAVTDDRLTSTGSVIHAVYARRVSACGRPTGDQFVRKHATSLFGNWPSVSGPICLLPPSAGACAQAR
jgi:serine/threonine protein kinase